MKVILSPAKSLDELVSCEIAKTSYPDFLDDSKILIGQLKKLTPKKIESLMGVSADLAHLNFDRFQSWKTPFSMPKAKPAALLFKGPAYQTLNFSNLSAKQQQTAQKKLRILSGLYGLLRPLDLILPYRLEMGTSLKLDSKTKNLYQFWGTKLKNTLEEEMDRDKSKVLVNVASSEYFKVLHLSTFKFPVITCVFKDRSKTGVYKVNMTYAKQARGMMARYIVANNLEKTEHLKAFDSSGYYYVPQESTQSEYVFHRDSPAV